MIFALLATASTLLTRGTTIPSKLTPGSSAEYSIALRRGESADVVVHQRGVDVVVELRSPHGVLLDSVDGPTGRDGDEPLEIFAGESGAYAITVRGFDAREQGDYVVEVKALRTRAATRSLLEERAAARRAATEWLRRRGGALSETYDSSSLQRLASNARLIALGEATHGTREFTDTRLGITRMLIEKHGFRFVAVEGSMSRADELRAYVDGTSPARPPESGWIGRRGQRELVEWLRAWNAAHPNDRVELVGLDAQDNASERETLAAFVRDAYGAGVSPAWSAALREVAAADEQTAVFGDSSISQTTRQTMFALVALLALDDVVLRAKLGDAAVTRAQRAAAIVAQFTDFNAGVNDPTSHSRDWYMATNALAAMRTGRRGVFWAHDAHVATTKSARTAGGVLRSVLGCDYAPIALTFGEGTFIAQVPNDTLDRIETFTLPAAQSESIESVMREVAPGRVIATWDCTQEGAAPPAWLAGPQPMHWIGGIYTPGTLPQASFRTFDLLRDFRGVIYVPRGTAEEIPPDRPVVPARKK